MSKEDLIKKLNEQLNREVTTFLRYMIQAAHIMGAQYESVRQMYLEEVEDEVEHAQYLANQIVMLGGRPKLSPDLTPPPDDVEKMLTKDSNEEVTDVKNYIQLASMAEKNDLFALKMKMEDQAADEDEHGQEMKRLLTRIC